MGKRGGGGEEVDVDVEKSRYERLPPPSFSLSDESVVKGKDKVTR